MWGKGKGNVEGEMRKSSRDESLDWDLNGKVVWWLG